VAREKWLELEVERQRQVADASVEQLSCAEQDKKELAKRVKQLEVIWVFVKP
jgi:U3 small nucleolar ribonucleoprotein component